MQRVVVIGVTGSGKTTMARELARKLGVPHLELDSLNWQPGWTMAAPDVFRERVAAHVTADGWVVDGNYSGVRDLVWTRADTVVWLDYPFALSFFRVLRRTLRRIWTGEELWNGNRERMLAQLLSRDSLLWWAITTHRRHAVTFRAALRGEAYRHLRVERFRSPRAARAWLESI